MQIRYFGNQNLICIIFLSFSLLMRRKYANGEISTLGRKSTTSQQLNFS